MLLAYGDNSYFPKPFFLSLVALDLANFCGICCSNVNDGFDRLDIGTSEPLILDVLINALTQISSE